MLHLVPAADENLGSIIHLDKERLHDLIPLPKMIVYCSIRLVRVLLLWEREVFLAAGGIE
jgi:hypothetical protein